MGLRIGTEFNLFKLKLVHAGKAENIIRKQTDFFFMEDI